MQPLVVGNWKMNGTIEETLRRIYELKQKLGDSSSVDVIIAPPFTALYSAWVVLQETSTIKLAAQNLHWETEGPYTGEVSGLFLKDIGCSHVIVGHSERRQYFGETDETVNRKIRTALGNELTPIFCLGETTQQQKAGKTEAVLEAQLRKGLEGLYAAELKDLVIAYEPVWAIGTGQNATPVEIEQAHRFIRHFLMKGYDAPTANRIRLLYGGSVTPDNAASLFQVKNVDGLLVGGASLAVDKFLKIIQAKN